MSREPVTVTGIDGLRYSRELEDRLNHIVKATFKTPIGAECLAYLRNITLNRILGPDSSAETLRHQEGMRFLVALIEKRIAAAEESRNES